MGTSIDGRLHPSRFTRPAAGVPTEILRRHYEAVHDRFDADGWIVGRVTMAEMATGGERIVAVNAPLAREPHLGHRNGRNLAVAIDPSGRVHYGEDNIGGDHVVAVLGEVTKGPPSSGAADVNATSGMSLGKPSSGNSFRSGKYG